MGRMMKSTNLLTHVKDELVSKIEKNSMPPGSPMFRRVRRELEGKTSTKTVNFDLPHED